jgi:hypothetical protein
MGYSKTHEIPRKEHFFSADNENCSKSIPRDLSEHDFPDHWKIKFHARYGCKKKNVEINFLLYKRHDTLTEYVLLYKFLFVYVLIFYVSIMHGPNVLSEALSHPLSFFLLCGL